ncbi:GNAT family N-acetyltransferase [bacterium]|nr:GNAT family N-acetyltransferase [bacterium]
MSGAGEGTATLAIRPAVAADSALIARFNAAMAEETEGRALDRARLLAGVEGLIARPEYGFYLVAEWSGEPAACLLVTYEWSDWRNGLFWWVQSVYVSPEHRRKGIYRAMYSRVRELAQADRLVCGLRLYVETDNTAARQTYESLGMREAHYRMYEEVFRA